MPPLNFQFIPINCINPNPQKGDSSLQTKFRYPKRHTTEVLTNIFGQYAAFADIRWYYFTAEILNRKSKPIVKVGIIGGDSTLHNVICSYVCLKQSAPRSFDGL